LNNSEIIDRDNANIECYLESRDVRYLGNLYEEHKEIVFLHCLRMVGNEVDAQDLASETFIKAFGNIDKFKTGLPFSPWLRRIAGNLCIDFLRKKSRYSHQPLKENMRIESQEQDEKNDPCAINTEDIMAAMRMLKPAQRRCFCLFYVHELSYKEIAALTGYPPGKVRSYIQNGRKNFKRFMENR